MFLPLHSIKQLQGFRERNLLLLTWIISLPLTPPPPHPPLPSALETTLSAEKRRTVMSLLAGHKSRKSTQQHGEGKKKIKYLHQSSSSDEIK